jgi:hypothetical protein
MRTISMRLVLEWNLGGFQCATVTRRASHVMLQQSGNVTLRANGPVTGPRGTPEYAFDG